MRARERDRLARLFVVGSWLLVAPLASACDDDDGNGGTVETGGDGGRVGLAGTSGGGAGLSGGFAGTNAGDGQDGSDGAGDGQNGDGASDGTEVDLTDDEVAGVMIAANAGEVTHGEIALERAVDPRVRGYAERMIEQHSLANFAVGRLLETTALEWGVPELAEQLSDQNDDSADALRGLSGREFDMRYMRMQRMMHARVLSIVDSTLLPSVENSLLRAQLLAMRAAVVDHLQQAAVLLAALAAEGDDAP